jgi:hypothetical protein
MAIMLSVYGHDGLLAQCDERCYIPTDKAGDCLCLGHNWGVGPEKAQEQTGRHAIGWLRQWVKEHGLDPRDLEIYVLGSTVPWQAIFPID